MILRVILFLFVARALWRLVFGILDGYASGGRETVKPQTLSVGLVRDPVCGTFVTRTNALVAGSGANIRYFCSEKCRSEWNR